MFVACNCPCGSQQVYSNCCEPYLTGEAIAPTAEALMRSRYTAYCKGHLDYLSATHHPAKRTLSDRAALQASLKKTEWLGLTILKVKDGQPEDATGMVEFVARFRADYDGQIHERSRFKQQKGRWFYLGGEQLPPVEPKRNELCWCGSGKNFKQCHGKSG